MKSGFWEFMNNNFLFVFMLLAMITPGIIIGSCKYSETLQAMKNGYEQKVDPETRHIIWVKIKTTAEQN